MKELLEYFKIPLAEWGWKGEDGRGLSHVVKVGQAQMAWSFTGSKACPRNLDGGLRGVLETNPIFWRMLKTSDKKPKGSRDDGLCSMMSSETRPRC